MCRKRRRSQNVSNLNLFKEALKIAIEAKLKKKMMYQKVEDNSAQGRLHSNDFSIIQQK